MVDSQACWCTVLKDIQELIGLWHCTTVDTIAQSRQRIVPIRNVSLCFTRNMAIATRDTEI